MTRTSQKPRNTLLIQGVNKYGRAAMYGKKARYLKKDWKPVVAKVEAPKEPAVKDFCGGKRTILPKEPKWYPAEDLPKRRATRKPAPKKAKLRSTITPGTVLILLAGRFQGKRVVFLKQLSSGLLLITGPFKVNGVPLRRVNQAYVIATSTKVDLTGFKVPEKFNDEYFKKRRRIPRKRKVTFLLKIKRKKLLFLQTV